MPTVYSKVATMARKAWQSRLLAVERYTAVTCRRSRARRSAGELSRVSVVARVSRRNYSRAMEPSGGDDG